jgi:hypothetical protein
VQTRAISENTNSRAGKQAVWIFLLIVMVGSRYLRPRIAECQSHHIIRASSFSNAWLLPGDDVAVTFEFKVQTKQSRKLFGFFFVQTVKRQHAERPQEFRRINSNGGWRSQTAARWDCLSDDSRRSWWGGFRLSTYERGCDNNGHHR